MLINSTNPEDNSENEVTKTIEVGTIICYNLEGHELEVSAILVDNCHVIQ